MTLTKDLSAHLAYSLSTAGGFALLARALFAEQWHNVAAMPMVAAVMLGLFSAVIGVGTVSTR
jgi:hypothetical protein